MATKRSRKRRKQRRSTAGVDGALGAAPEAVADPAPAGDAAAPSTRKGDAAAPPTRKGDATAPPKRADGPPQAPWGSFPLSEIVVLVAIVLLVGGFFVAPPRGGVMIGAGLVLGSLAGLELSAREHFAGFRSHTALLAGAAGVATVAGLLALTELDPALCAGAGLFVFGLAAWALAGAFRKRSGGALFRFGGGR